MNRYNGTIKAFSVMEALFSMVITAIVMGLVFVVFTILSERMLDFKNQNQFIADMNRLTYALNKDIFDSDELIVNDEQLTFTAYSGNQVRYEWNENYTIRDKNGFLDTFKIPLTDLKIDTLRNKSQRMVFERVSVNIEVNKRPMRLSFFKKLYSNQLIEKVK